MSRGCATKPTRICSKDTVKATGLNIWVSGEHNDDQPVVDVIAVQGLGAHPYYTWVRKQNAAKEVKPRNRHLFKILGGRQKNAPMPNVARTASDAAEIMWLRDLLPSLIPNARIATYSYESDWRSADVKTSLRKCGEQLLNVLHQNRYGQKACRRPLVLIGHSLGGLVIKQALILANHGDNFRDIRLSTAGIIFLGTPHNGSDAAVYGAWLAQAIGHDKTLLESLKRNSPALYDIARDFEASYKNADIVCFYEDKNASCGPLRTRFVDHQSASLHGKRAMYLTTDHSGLNKFCGPEDENFLLLKPEIQRIVQTAPRRVEENYHSHDVLTETESFRIGFSLQGIPVVDRFVARDVEMTQLTQVLLPTSTDQMRRKVFVLYGLGGIGKTQLSVEFIRKHQRTYSAVFWIDGSTKERLRRSIADVASRLPQHQVSEESRRYTQEGSTNIDSLIEDVLKWLSQPLNDQWLLVFDNVDREFSIPSGDPEAFDVKNYFPEADQGSILITSRLASLWRLGADQKLKPVDEMQGQSILHNSLGRSVEGSSELVHLLQGLPLAINQAGSYMRETSTRVPDYIKLYNQAWGRLMEKQQRFTSREDSDCSVLTTWTLSFNHLRAQSEDAANLLMLWAFLDNHDLWYELLTPALGLEIADEVPDWFARCVGDEFEFKENIGLLLRYSFIDANTESCSFSMHSVLHHWCFHAFKEDRPAMSWLAVITVASAAPSKTVPQYTLIQRRLLPHCDRVFSLLQRPIRETFRDRADLPSISGACHELGDLYSYQSKTNEAEVMYLRALRGKEKAYGPEHTSTLDTVNNLGVLYNNQDKLQKAEDMYLRALRGKEKVYGPEDTSTLDTVNNLGVLYGNQDKLQEAEDMYLRALRGKEKVYSPEDISTLDMVNNLGLLYKNQDKLQEAEDMYLRALKGKEKGYGPEHTSTLNTVNNLGVLYTVQDKMKEAEDMFLRALTGKEKTWGPEHTSTLNTVYSLGILYRNQDKMKEAEDMFLRALTGYEKAYGPEHTATLATVNDLALLYDNQDKLQEAEDMYLRALRGEEKVYGPEDTSTLDTVNNLGLLYKNQDKLQEAEVMYLRALKGKEKAYGPEHTSTLDTVHNLGVLYDDQGKMKEAEDMYQRALIGYEKNWGPEHTSTLATVNNLGVLYDKQGKKQEAEDMYLRALTGMELVWGPEHKRPLDTRYNLALIYKERSMFDDATQQFELVVQGYTITLGPEHSETVDALKKLESCKVLLEENKGTFKTLLSKATTAHGISSWVRWVRWLRYNDRSLEGITNGL